MRPLALTLALSLALAPASAAAQSKDPKYKAALKLEKSGDIVGALAGFESIPVEKRDFDTRLHIASAKEKLGRLLEAERDYEAIRTDPKADAATVESAAANLQDLRPRIPKLVLKLTPATTGVTVSVDGHDASLPVTVTVNPGTHSVVAKRGDDEVFKRDVTIAESSTMEVLVDAPAASPTVTYRPEPVKPQPAADVPSSSSGHRTLGWVALGAGGAFAVLGVVSYLQANSATDDYRATCGTFTCDEDLKSKVRTWETMTWIGAGAAVVSVGIGVTLLVTAPKDSGVAVRATTGRVNGLVLEGRF